MARWALLGIQTLLEGAGRNMGKGVQVRAPGQKWGSGLPDSRQALRASPPQVAAQPPGQPTSHLGSSSPPAPCLQKPSWGRESRLRMPLCGSQHSGGSEARPQGGALGQEGRTSPVVRKQWGPGRSGLPSGPRPLQDLPCGWMGERGGVRGQLCTRARRAGQAPCGQEA